MTRIKCIGCYELRREVMEVEGKNLVVYDCHRYPYACVISGLLRPGKGLLGAVSDCPEDPLSHCVICPETKFTHYSEGMVSVCEEHGRAWGNWLNDHLGRREYMAPRHRAIKARWIEVFREFIEDMRSRLEGQP